MRALKGSRRGELDVYFSKASSKSGIIISPVVWSGTSRSLFECGPSFPLRVCVWRRRRRRCRRAGPDAGTVHKALLNKALKYYPKLKDIHTCLESSPPLRSSCVFLGRCGLVSMATGGFLFQVRPCDGFDGGTGHLTRARAQSRRAPTCAVAALRGK